MQHWQGIIVSACEQSGRNIIPSLNSAITLKKWSETISQTCLVFDPLATETLKSIEQTIKFITVIVGPEGGLSSTEIQELNKQENVQTIKFGPRILRTETAALSAITAIQLLWGDLLK